MLRKISMIWIAFFTSCFVLFAGSCSRSPAKQLVTQTFTVNWKGASYSRDYLCAPTVFPEARRGGGDPFSGATFSGHKRKEKLGMSPTPQWMTIQTDDDTLLIQLACNNQWKKFDHVLSKPLDSESEQITPEAASDVYLAKAIGRNYGLTPISNPDIQISGPKSISNIDNALARAREQISELERFSSILEAFSFSKFSSFFMYKAQKVLPKEIPEGSRSFSIEPWYIDCNSDVLLSLETAEGKVYTRAGQAFLDGTDTLQGCKFLRFFDSGEGRDIDQRTDSPYRKIPFGMKFTHTPLGLKNKVGDHIILEVDRIKIGYPELMVHLPEGRGSKRYRRDPFLDSEVYVNGLKPAIDSFAASGAKAQGE